MSAAGLPDVKAGARDFVAFLKIGACGNTAAGFVADDRAQ
jgi:hypothetical protein